MRYDIVESLDPLSVFKLEELRIAEGGKPSKPKEEVLREHGINDLTEEEKIRLVANGRAYDLGLIHYMGIEAEDMVIKGYIQKESPLKTLRILKEKYPNYAEELKVSHLTDYLEKNKKMQELVASVDKEIAKRTTELVLKHEELIVETVNEARELLKLTKQQRDYATANRILNTMINAAVAHAKLTGKIGVDGNTQVNVQINQVVESVMKDGNTFLDRLKQRQIHRQLPISDNVVEVTIDG